MYCTMSYIFSYSLIITRFRYNTIIMQSIFKLNIFRVVVRVSSIGEEINKYIVIEFIERREQNKYIVKEFMVM